MAELAGALDTYVVGDAVGRPGLVLCHGFPSPQRPGSPRRTYHLLADRIANELDWTVLAVSLRGCGQSRGQFSAGGWVDDIQTAVAHLREAVRCAGVWLAGSTTGGSLCIAAAAQDEQIEGVATIAARADLNDLADGGDAFVDHCRAVGVITDERYPTDVAAWCEELRQVRPVESAATLPPRPLLVMHGTADRQVPSDDAIRIADAHGSAELRLIDGADHRLRHDPRAVALLFGWLERQGGGE